MTGALRFVYPLGQADEVFHLADAAQAAVHLTTCGQWAVIIGAGPLADAIRAQLTGVPDEALTHPEVELIGEGGD